MEIALLKADISDLPVFNPEVKTIPVYRRLIERDRGSVGDSDGRKKKQSTKELAFIHLYTHFQLTNGKPNPYWKKSPQDKLDSLKKDLEMPDDWKLDDELKLAIEHYEGTFVKTLSLEMLEGAMVAAMQTVKYFKNVDYDKKDSRGNLIYDPQKVMKTIKEINSTIDEINSAMERVQNEQKASLGRIRGGGEAGSREVPKRA